MGAGAVKEASFSADKTEPEQSEDMSSCELCSVNFTLLKRKKLCTDCGKMYCANCMSKQTVGKITHRRCKQCQLLTSGNFTRGDLMALPTKDLRSFIMRRKIPMNNCREKADLVEILLSTSNNSHYRKEQAARYQHLIELEERKRQREAESGHWGSARSGQNAERTTAQQSNDNTSSDSQPTLSFHPSESSNHAAEPEQSHSVEDPSVDAQLENMDTEQNTAEQQSNMNTGNMAMDQKGSPLDSSPSTRRVTHLRDMKDIKDIEALTVRQLKEILATNYVVYKGCCEKWELIDRVKRLWIDREKNIDKASTSNDDNEICKICMDAVIDCVLLDCGHMVACTQCGKQMAECPMCRQYVVRVVHVFKA